MIVITELHLRYYYYYYYYDFDYDEIHTSKRCTGHKGNNKQDIQHKNTMH